MFDEQRITEAIFALLHARVPGGTICPSEVARTLEPARWRPLMPNVRAVARALARSNRLELRQRNATLDPDAEFRGPIRLALPATPLPGDASGVR